MLYVDMERQLGEQQFSAASYVASEINTQLQDRINALELISRAITPVMLNNHAALQQFIDQRFVLHTQFNGGQCPECRQPARSSFASHGAA
jgi:hypothetical protein